ncbi:MAG: ABC transporter substrate-binding protein [bacterium]
MTIPKIILNNKPYINGNILNLPFFNTTNAENGTFGSPWKEQRINTAFLYRSLFLPDDTLQKISPDLASSYTLLNDNLTYSINLSDNNYWSDGVRITIDDIIFTIEAILKDDDVLEMYRTVLSYIEGAGEFISGEARLISGISSNGNTLNINLSKPYKNFMIVLSQAVIIPKHILEEEVNDVGFTTLNKSSFWSNPVVSGMYMLDEVVKNPEQNDYYFKLVHNPYYTQPKSEIEEVRFHVNYQDKGLDYYETNLVSEMVTYSNNNNYSKYDVSMFLYQYFVFNIAGNDQNYNQPIDDELFREAIIYALNREKMLSNVYLNNGAVTHSGLPDYNNSSNDFKFDYDPEKATELLNNSSYNLNRVFRIAYTQDDDETILYLLSEVKSNLNAIGLEVELVYLDDSNNNLEESVYITRDYDMLLKDLKAFNEYTWYSEYDESRIVYNNLINNATEFENLYTLLCESTSDQAEKEYFLELQRLEQQGLYKIPMFVLNQVVYTNNERLNLPQDLNFGNSWYRYDVNLKDWSIKKD